MIVIVIILFLFCVFIVFWLLGNLLFVGFVICVFYVVSVVVESLLVWLVYICVMILLVRFVVWFLLLVCVFIWIVCVWSLISLSILIKKIRSDIMILIKFMLRMVFCWVLWLFFGRFVFVVIVSICLGCCWIVFCLGCICGFVCLNRYVVVRFCLNYVLC